MTKAMTADERFFYDNAGYATPPGRRECARLLAKAEADAREVGLVFEWQEDVDGELPEACSACRDGDRHHTHEILGCVAKDASGAILASLWGIIGPSKAYGRVVEAELASEALHSVGYAPTFPK